MLQDTANMLLQNALGVIPIALVVAVVCKAGRMRPATRHTLWLGVLVFLIIPPTLPEFSRSLLESAAPIRDTTPISRPIPTSVGVALPGNNEETASPVIRADSVRRVRTNRTRSASPERSTNRSRSNGNGAILSQRLLSGPLDDFYATPSNLIEPLDRSRPSPQSRAQTSVPRASESSESELLVTGDVQSTGIDRPASLTVMLTTWRSAQGIAGEVFARAQARGEEALASLRSTVGALPRIPAWLWFGGVLVVLLTAMVRLLLACRLFRLAKPAPDSVRLMIDSAAQEMGLSRTPLTLMVEDRVSPMVWCGWRTTLVLPKSLWSDLDDAGRRAVVRHELAHIKRRDHWVRWAELLIGTLYWWHPIVWWARRRIHEEADLSCDLWVTSLIPGVREPYARALLMTKQYVSAGGGGVPSVGIGAVSPGARRFSRRITMVMTTRMNPKTSILGVALATSLVLGGVYSAPTWACDTPEPTKPALAPAAPQPSEHLSTFEQYMIDRVPEPAPETSPCDQAVPTADAPCDSPCRSSRVATTLGEINGKIHSIVSDQLSYSSGGASLYMVGDSDAESTVLYHLPDDRLESLVVLMSRDDVPVLIETAEDGIVVHGNAEQQRRFAAFVAILNPKEEIVAYRLTSGGKLKDLTTLMAIGTVPTLINFDNEAIHVHGDINTQRAFADFVEMIDPGAHRKGAKQGEGHASNEQFRHPLEDEAAKVELRVLGMFEEAQRLREMEEIIMAQAEAIEAQADEIETQSDSHRDQAEALMDEIEALLESVEELTSAEQYEAMVEAETAGHEASRMMRLAEVIESQIDMVMAQAETLTREAESFGDQADALEDEAEELAESLEEQLEDLEEMLESRLDEFNDWTQEYSEAFRELLQEHAERLDEQLSQRFGR